MKRLIPLLLASACHLAAHAADTLPAHVAGSWGSAQTVMYLQADGDGLMAGSTSSAAGMDGNARPIIGFPVRATLDGDTLLLRPILPPGAPVENVVMTCRYMTAGTAPSFTCTGPDKTPFVLQRLDAALPAEAAATIAGLKAQRNGS